MSLLKKSAQLFVLCTALASLSAQARGNTSSQTATEERGKENAPVIITETTVSVCDASILENGASSLDRTQKCAPKKITCVGGQGDASKACHCPKGTSEKDCLKLTKCPEGEVSVPAECSAIKPKPPAGSVCTACVGDF